MRLGSKLRSHIACLLREYRWLAGAATTASGLALAMAIEFQGQPFTALAAAACLVVTAFTWGYSTRAFRMPPWRALTHLQRRQYAETWDALASSPGAARAAVSGKQDEDELRNSAAEPVRNLLELASIGAEDEVLEIGCGVGRIGRELAPRCRSWTGADISANMLACASDRLRGIGNVRLQQLLGRGLSELGDNSFDVVYCVNMLAHLDEVDRWRYVQEAFRVLRSGGRIFLDNIDFESDEGWAAFANGVRHNQDCEPPPYTPRFSTAAEFVLYATRAGFGQILVHRRLPLLIVTAVKSGSD